MTTQGKSERSAEVCAAAGISPLELYLRHMARVVSHVKKRAPNLRVLMWHDMIERVDILPEELRVAEPVVWRYTPELSLPPGLLKGRHLFSKA